MNNSFLSFIPILFVIFYLTSCNNLPDDLQERKAELNTKLEELSKLKTSATSIADYTMLIKEYTDLKENLISYTDDCNKRGFTRNNDELIKTITQDIAEIKSKIPISYEDALSFIQERCLTINQTLMRGKISDFNGKTVYMFLTVAKNGEACISMVPATPPLEVIASNCGEADEKLSDWNAIVESNNSQGPNSINQINNNKDTIIKADNNNAKTSNVHLPSYVPNNGLIGWYPFTGNANDSSGSGNNGILNGVTLTTDRFGNANSACYFNGNSYIMCQHNTPLPTKSLTISAWFNQYLSFGGIEYICLGNTTSTSWGCMASTNLIQLDYAKGCGGIQENNISHRIVNNKWYHIVYVSNGVGDSTTVYLNDTLIGNLTNGKISISSCSTNNLYFGVDIFSAPEYITGKLDDIGIWNRVLSPSEIKGLYLGVVSPKN